MPILTGKNGNYTVDRSPERGLVAARMMAMTTYRSWASFAIRYGRHQPETGSFAIVDYLHYQGQKLVERFDANTYVTLTHVLDSHDVARENQGYESTLQSIKQPALIVAIDSDILYPPVEQEELARLIPNAKLERLASPHGHDAFLIDMDTLNELVVNFRRQLPNRAPNQPMPLLLD